MGLLKLAMAGATGFAMYRIFQKAQKSEHAPAAFAHGEATPGFAPVRNAGPERREGVIASISHRYPVSSPRQLPTSNHRPSP